MAWEYTIEGSSTVFSTTELNLAIFQVEAVLTVDRIEFDKRPDLKFDFLVDTTGPVRQWKQTIDVVFTPPEFSATFSPITGSWNLAQSIAITRLRDVFISLAQSNGATYIEFNRV